MKDKEILNIINEFERDFKLYKDSGRAMIKQLAVNLNRVEGKEKKDFIDFCIREIASNKNGLWSLCLQVIVKANQFKVAPELERVYHMFYETKDTDWKEDIVMAMLKLNYKKPDELYNSFIKYHLKNKTGRAFFLMVEYCRVNFSKCSELLSNYFVNNMLSEDSFEYNNQHHIGYLIYGLINIPNGCLSEIIKQTSKKNKVAGNYLKQAILSFLNSKSGNLNSEQIKEITKKINEINI